MFPTWRRTARWRRRAATVGWRLPASRSWLPPGTAARTREPDHRDRRTTRPPIRRATTDVPARGHRRDRRGLGVGAILDELDELLDRPDLRAEHEHVPDVSPRRNGSTPPRCSARRWRRGPAPGTTRSPSGIHPSPIGSGRTSHSANVIVPTTKTSARIGVADGSPRPSSALATGVSRMPPTDGRSRRPRARP